MRSVEHRKVVTGEHVASHHESVIHLLENKIKLSHEKTQIIVSTKQNLPIFICRVVKYDKQYTYHISVRT